MSVVMIATQYPMLYEKRIELVTGIFAIHRRNSPGGIHLSSYIPGYHQRGEQLCWLPLSFFLLIVEGIPVDYTFPSVRLEGRARRR